MYSLPQKRPRSAAAPRGFTLLELLVVVGILAIIAGATIVAYQGFQRRASDAASMSSMKTLSQTLLAFREIEQQFPDNLESMLSAVPTNPQFDSSSLNSQTQAISGARELRILSDELAAAFEPRALTVAQLDSLRAVGLNRVRFVDQVGDELTAGNLTIQDASGNTGKRVGPINEIKSAIGVFEIPSMNANNDTNRGYILNLGPEGTYPTGLELMVWGGQGTGAAGEPPVGQIFENTRVSADPGAVLVGLGIGRSSTLTRRDLNDPSAVGETNLATAPFDAGMGFNQYQHFILLLDVSKFPAQFVAVVDPRGIPLEEKSVSGGTLISSP